MTEGHAALPLVRLEQAIFGYSGRPVVSGVDLRVESGDVIGILGPNGAGKTTLFRGILGLIRPLAGRVERSDVPVGYVPQREALDAVFPLTAIEVVRMGAYGRLRGLRRLRAEDRELAEHCLARVGLADRRRALYQSLSGGQRQRVLIARALMARPRLLLLDEPTSGVDRAAERKILALLEELGSDGDLAILLVSHEIALVREAVRRVLWVADGAVRHGSPEDLLGADRLDELFAGR